MPEFGTSALNKKNCYRAFGIISIITITALVVVIIKNSSHESSLHGESSSVIDENNADFGQQNPSPPDGCYPPPDGRIPQYIIGYGSLMQTASKLRTYPNAKENIPVLVRGFSRHWNIEGSSIGFSTTYLGVQLNDTATINGVIFQIPGDSQADLTAAISNYDTRERFYCRLEVAPEKIEVLNITEETDQIMNSKEKKAQFWIYYNRPINSKDPSAKYPIVQSYVDVFLSGCIELAEKFKLDKFADMCVTNTEGWSRHWVNDRILPRRPFSHTPMSTKIDKMLYRLIPGIFKAIKIEG